MNYQTFEPSNDLKPFIKCYWTLEIPEQTLPQKQRIVPDGCMEMIFHHGDLYKQYLEKDEYIIQPRCFVFGQLTSTLEIEPTGVTGIFAARFHPDGFNVLGNFPIKKLENTATALVELFGEAGIQLEQDILKTNKTEEKITILENFLMACFSNSNNIDRLIKSVINTILEAQGQMSVEEISQEFNIHRRQLERKFASTIGLSPKQLTKIVRLQTCLKKLISGNYSNLTDLAYESDFYDQAHFIKDFKEFTGISPKDFFSDNLKFSSLIHGES